MKPNTMTWMCLGLMMVTLNGGAVRAAVKHTPDSPRVERIYTVAPGILAISIRAQEVIPSRLTPYVAQPGDQRTGQPTGEMRLKRGGKEIAWLIGPKRDTMVTFEGIKGDPLQETLASRKDTWRIQSREDPVYAQPVEPVEVSRKSTPTDWEQPGNHFPMRHIVYLRLPRPLTEGKTYEIDLSRINTRHERERFTFKPAETWSEAVHINQIGFRPDDPLKRGFLSVWLGTGGTLAYPEKLKFSVVDDKTGTPALTGTIERAKAATEPEMMFKNVNYNKTDVYRFDFPALQAPGRYRVVVEGVGCSYPFEIADDVWLKAFLVQMKGFYHQRSGIELGPPYTTYRRPRDFHPADGVPVYQTDYSVLEGEENFKELPRRSTGKLMPEAWGGYHDAGDWNPRRVTHMRGNTDLLLELIDLFPETFGKLAWNIPRDYPLPPMLNEIMFEVDFFRRLQRADGAVSFGIETPGDPITGEVSWKQSMAAYVYAPDPWSSYIYASVAARLARVLERFNKPLAQGYRESALRAMTWAESQWPTAGPKIKPEKKWRVTDDRNFAALELYRLTRDKHWHEVFLQDTCLTEEHPGIFWWNKHVQQHAAFAYAVLPDDLADPQLKRKAREGTIELAERELKYAAGNAFNLTNIDKYRPMSFFFYSVPDAMDLVRAHYLTGERKYLAGLVQACLFPAGANPRNATYTVGVGSDWPHNPLKLDTRRTGQPTPLGQTVYGNNDYLSNRTPYMTWPITFYLGKICTPSAWDWPLPEAYFDIFLFPMQNEYTVEGFGRNAYLWGYLAARPKLQ